MKPNVFFLIIDAFRNDEFRKFCRLHPTSNLNKLVSKGNYFSQTVSSADATLLSLASMFTGLYPFKTGIKSEKLNKLNSNVYINNLKPILDEKIHWSLFKIGKNLRVTYDICPKYKLSDDLNHDLKMKYLEDEINVIEIKFLKEHSEEARLILKKVPFVVKRHSKYLRGLAKCGLASYV